MTKLIAPKQQAEPRSAVELIGTFAAAVRSEHLTTENRQLFKRNILDSIGCAISAVAGPSLRPLRDQIEEYRAPGRCTLIGGGKTSPDQAALFNSALVRYVDLLDSYMSPGGLCHPGDNFGTVLTAAVPVMAKGFNHALQLAISASASAGRLLGLSAGQIANAIAIAAVDNVSLACVHAEPVSQWKGFSPGMTGMRAVYAAALAKRGFTGPSGLFEGPNGLERMLGQAIAVDWDDPSLEFVKQTVLKKYCSLIHGQPVLEAVLELKRRNDLSAAEVEHVRCDICQTGFDIAGGGGFGAKDHPQTKEQADYNLKYLIAAALLDDQVGPAQLEPARVRAPDAQALLARVDIRPDGNFTSRYPQELDARVTLRMKDQRVFVKEQLGYEGGLANPLSWDRTVEKFHWLSEAFADAELRHALVRAVQRLDARPLSELTDLLAQIR